LDFFQKKVTVIWEKSFIFKEDNVVTKSVPNSGKLFQMNTVLTPPDLITEIQIFN